jgi:hypothetical protein
MLCMLVAVAVAVCAVAVDALVDASVLRDDDGDGPGIGGAQGRPADRV